MRILSATIINYRLHGRVQLSFDSRLTLIGGLNETGKSTLIEAIHRALFLKAKGNTDLHRSMTSELHSGNPEVEVKFEAEGRTYTVTKRFGGNGSVRVVPSDSKALTGEQAETELSRVLRVEAGLAMKSRAMQWNHLWVWQGKAAENPVACATLQKDGLFRRLQDIGEAVALQSGIDAQVAAHFAQAAGEIFTQANKPKVDSELHRAEEGCRAAVERRDRALEVVQRLDNSVLDLEHASQNFERASHSLTELDKQRADIQSKVTRLAELRQLEGERSGEVRIAVDDFEKLNSADSQIVNQRLEIANAEARLRPGTEEIVRLRHAVDEARRQVAAAGGDLSRAVESLRSARLYYDTVAAHAVRFEKTEIHSKFKEKHDRVSELRNALGKLEQQSAELPKVGQGDLRELQGLESESARASTSLQAMAAGLEVIASDLPVMIGDQVLSVGCNQILTEDTEVAVGSNIRFRIRPGGGTSLAEARDVQKNAVAALRAALNSLGIESVQRAMEVCAQREDLSSRIQAARAEMTGMGAETLDEDLRGARNELTEAHTRVERFLALAPDTQLPDNRAASRKLALDIEGNLKEAELREREARAVNDRLTADHEDGSRILREKQAELDEQGRHLNGLSAQLALLLKSHGVDLERGQRLNLLRSAMETARERLKGTLSAIAELQPEQLETDSRRISRAIEQKTNERIEANTQIRVARAALCSDGSNDPAGSLVTAESEVGWSQEYRDSVRRKSEAIALLNRLFQEEQQQLAARFTRPLSEKVSGYLQCIFGPRARASVGLADGEFGNLLVAREALNDVLFEFGTLSGGAREQISAAFRLAMAEVLAPEHGGCLPVVFDDAFTSSDSERIDGVQRMLDLAATRGLQIIVLTCNPSDYEGLGAKVATTLRHYQRAYGAQKPNLVEVNPDPIDAESGGAVDTPSPDVAEDSVSGALCQRLVQVLTEQGGSSGNQTLRELLGWDEDTYKKIKNSLVSAGKLTTGRGRGGSVSLAKG